MTSTTDDLPDPIGDALGGSATCRRDGCDKRARFYPCVSVWALGKTKGSHEPIRIVANLPLCKLHSRGREWFTETMREEMERRIVAAEPFAAPRDWPRAAFQPVSIANGDHPHDRNPVA